MAQLVPPVAFSSTLRKGGILKAKKKKGEKREGGKEQGGKEQGGKEQGGKAKGGKAKKRGKAKSGGGGAVEILMWSVLDLMHDGEDTVTECATECMRQLLPTLELVRARNGSVVIELQPPIALQKFHHMQHELHGMALGFGLPVRFQHAKVKSTAVVPRALGADYATRKRCAIEDCEAWLVSNGADIAQREWFASLPKRDDAADALLHAAVALSRDGHGTVLGIDVGMTNLGVCVLSCI